MFFLHTGPTRFSSDSYVRSWFFWVHEHPWQVCGPACPCSSKSPKGFPALEEAEQEAVLPAEIYSCTLQQDCANQLLGICASFLFCQWPGGPLIFIYPMCVTSNVTLRLSMFAKQSCGFKDFDLLACSKGNPTCKASGCNRDRQGHGILHVLLHAHAANYG